MAFRVSDLMVDVHAQCPAPSNPACPSPSKPQCPSPSKATERTLPAAQGLPVLQQQLRRVLGRA